MLKLATFVLNDVDHAWMPPEDTVMLKCTGRNQGRSAALNVTANDEAPAVGELNFNVGQDGTPACGGIQQSICEYLKEPSPTLHQQVQQHTS